MYDFDTLVPEIYAPSPMRRRLDMGGFPKDSICYGVAEMKFKLLPEIIQAVKTVTENGWLGYSAGYEEYYSAVCSWMERRHDWQVTPDELVQSYGVVQAIGISIRAFTNPGDSVLIQTPVYNHFFEEVEMNGRVPIDNTLIFADGKYTIDFNDFEEKIKKNKIKLFVLCSPHNPVGRVWTVQELETMANICEKYGVIVVSDEIHNDIVYGGAHNVYANVSEAAADNCVVCTAPSKTFNVPGLVTSNIIIKNKTLREKFIKEQSLCGHFINPVGIAACRAAYEYGDKWVDEMAAYIGENMNLLKSQLAQSLPKAVLAEAEGTYLAWADFGAYGLGDDELMRRVTEIGGFCVNPGHVYGETGKGFLRINVGCPKKYVEEAVVRLYKSLEDVL